jgi:hypothetical protein
MLGFEHFTKSAKLWQLCTLTLFLHKRRGLIQVKGKAHLPKNSIEFKLERRKLLRGNHVNELCLNHKSNSGQPCQQPLLKLQKQFRTTMSKALLES